MNPDAATHHPRDDAHALHRAVRGLHSAADDDRRRAGHLRPAATFDVPATALLAGQQIVYAEGTYTVAEVLTVRTPLSGHVVIGIDAEGTRVPLIYARTGATAEVVSL